MLYHQFTVWSDWKSGSGWLIGSGSQCNSIQPVLKCLLSTALSQVPTLAGRLRTKRLL